MLNTKESEEIPRPPLLKVLSKGNANYLHCFLETKVLFLLQYGCLVCQLLVVFEKLAFKVP